jgi:hypothetical protein
MLLTKLAEVTEALPNHGMLKIAHTAISRLRLLYTLSNGNHRFSAMPLGVTL